MNKSHTRYPQQLYRAFSLFWRRRSIIEADPIATCVRAMMANRTVWTGTALDLLRLCAESARDDIASGGP
jgi:hypothetical protein